MNGILGEILQYKRIFVENSKKKLPLRELEHLVLTSDETRDFTGALSGNGCSLIAEIKTASPSKGVIRDDVDIEDIARIYSANGAACISVLTDEKYFMGSLDRLTRIRNVTEVPLLRKDFIIDVYQIFEARYAGADAILLIAACLNDADIKDFIEVAALLDMDCLVEVHDEIEMKRMGNLDIKLIGINNRDLNTFTTDISVTGRLTQYAPENTILISESGINNAQDVQAVYSMGANVVLVGEALMREKDIGRKVRELSQAISATTLR